jgi:PmbA protein
MTEEKIIDSILKNTKGYDCHIILTSYTKNLTRFGDNEISQNVSSTDISANVRITDGERVYKFVISKFDEISIKDAISRAVSNMKMTKKAEFIPPPTTSVIKIDSDRYFDESVSSISPIDKVSRIKKFLNFCSKTGRLSYGTISNSYGVFIVANSNGIFQRQKETSYEYEITVNKDGAYGKAVGYSFKDDINIDEINEKALNKSDLSKNPIEIKPSKYTIIVEPLAVSEFLPFFGYLGFNALAFYEKRSFATDNLGKKIFSEKLTIYDDPSDISCPNILFDLEGMPRKKIVLVEKGVLKNLITDKKTSKLCNMPYTGNSVFEPNAVGAIPFSLSVESGQRSLQDIIKDTEKGILVTEFHYTNVLKPKTIEMTGMTRNGTYLIESGKIKKAIKNMRFTQNMVEALNNIEEISKESYVFKGWWSVIKTPAIKIRDFNFTSSTEF